MRHHIQWIDVAKGLAMLGVMAVHVSQSISGIPKYFLDGIVFGAMGVQLFFMMSAYTVCESLLKKKAWSYTTYLKNKMVRLLPIYLLGICIYGCWAFAAASFRWIEILEGAKAYTVFNILTNVTLLNTFFPAAQNNIVPGGWSISCIAVFYMVAPFLFRWLQQKNYGILLFLSLGGVAIAFGLHHVGGIENYVAYFSIFNQFSVFIIGMLYWQWRHQHLLSQRSLSILIIVFVASILVLAMVMRYGGHSYWYRHLWTSISFCLLLIILERKEGQWPHFVEKIGQRSYAIFLIHFFFAWILCRMLNNYLLDVSALFRFVLFYGITVVASCTLAGWIEWCYERPINKVIERVILKRHQG